MSIEAGITLLHKPVGATSFQLVRAAMDALAREGRKLPLCHGGTLDPFAEGLLLLLAGPATKLMDWLHEAPKTYRAEIAWGAETDNGDAGGAVVMRGDAAGLTPERIEAATRPLLGWTDQVPPATSAKKLGGEPAYKKAHRGETVELPPSRVYLHSARWLSHALPDRSTVELVCRGGYYVRAFARDLGRALGCGAHVKALARVEIGPWKDPGPDRREHFHGRALMPWLPSVNVTRRQWDAVGDGQPLPEQNVEPARWKFPNRFPPPTELVRAFHQDKLVALLEPRDGALRTRVLLGRGC